MAPKKVFHMTPDFASFVGTLLTSGNAKLASTLVNAFMVSHGGAWEKVASEIHRPYAYQSSLYSSQSQGRIFQPHCASQANAVKRQKTEARELARG